MITVQYIYSSPLPATAHCSQQQMEPYGVLGWAANYILLYYHFLRQTEESNILCLELILYPH